MASAQELIVEAIEAGAALNDVETIVQNTNTNANANAIMAELNIQEATPGRSVPVGEDLTADLTLAEPVAEESGVAQAGSMEELLVTAPRIPSTDMSTMQTLTGAEISNEIAAQQQAIITGVPTITMPEAQAPASIKSVPMVGVEGGAVPADLQSAMDRNKAITDRISKQLEQTLISPEQAQSVAAAADATTTANQIIALTSQTEGLKIQDQLIEVTASVNNPAHQKSLIERQAEQAADMQATAQEIEDEAEAGGLGYMLKSMLNQEIYGNASGRKGIQLQSEVMQYNATSKEITDITASTQAMATANTLTSRIITKGTIAANQNLIAAQGNQAKYDAILEQNQSNASALKSMLSVSSQEMNTITAMYQLQGSAAARALARERLAFEMSRVVQDDALRAIRLQREGVALKLDNINLRIKEEGLTDELKVARNAAKLSDITLQRQGIALSVDDGTAADKLALSKDAVAKSGVDLANARQQLAENTDPARAAALQAQYSAAQTAAERAAMDFDEWQADAALRADLDVAAQIDSQQRVIINQNTIDMTKGTQAAQVAATNARNNAITRQAETDERVKQEQTVAVQAFESFIYGGVRSSSKTIEARLAAGDPLFRKMRQDGSVSGPNGEFVLGTSFAKANEGLAFYEAHGVVSNDILGVKVLREIRDMQDRAWAADPTTIPDDDTGKAVQFNQTGRTYLADKKGSIVHGDTTNPFQPPTLPQLSTSSPTWAKSPLGTYLNDTGQVDTNVEQIANSGLAAINAGKLTSDELVSGLLLLGDAIHTNSAAAYGGLEVIGQANNGTVNVRVGKPRGLAGSVFNFVSDNLEGAVVPAAVGLVAAGIILTAPVSVPVLAGTGAAILGSGVVAGSAAAGVGTAALATAYGVGASTLTSSALRGTSDYININITDPVMVRQYVVSLRASTTIGGVSTSDIESGEQ